MKIGRKIALILGLLIILDTLVFAFLNLGKSLTFVYPPFVDFMTVDLGLGTLIFAVYIALGIYLLMYFQIRNLQDKTGKESRNAEKASIKSEASASRIKALEQKVQTLEVALKSALGKK